jgi:alpha-tubulin suppressor-like RCC1 family protein/serine/threonine protein kinase
MAEELDRQDVGDLEDDYELLGEVGRGGSAVVFRARDRTLGRLVAIKVVRARYAATAEDALERLGREARTVARLQHPNIVTVHAVRSLREGGLALVMQFVPGRTLKDAIAADGPFEPARAERVLYDVAQALAFAHANGVVHRDVKPENIFLEEGSQRALLSDFGIAQSTEFDSRLTMTGAAIGTPTYMAPELIDGADATPRSDIYALGLVAWEMLTGEKPWAGEPLYNILHKQKHEELPPIDALRPGVVPERLQYIVERMLQKRPAARWAGAEGLLANLAHWVEPGDFGAWRAVHRRRREARPAVARSGASSATAATVRFTRTATPSSTPTPLPVPAGTPMSTPAVVPTVAEDDATPSWALTPAAEPPSRAPRLVVLGVGALVALAVAAVGAQRLGWEFSLGRASAAVPPAAPALATADSIVWAPGDSAGAGAGASTDSTAADSAALRAQADSLERALLAARADSARRLILARADSARLDAPVTTPVPVPGAPAAPATTSRNGERAPAGPPAAAPAPLVATIRVTDDPPVVATGGRHSCAIDGGRVLCWGANEHGQLGTGDSDARETAAPIDGELEFMQVAAGLAHSCALTRSGEAYCWGADERGQLGDATTTSRSAPVRVAGSWTFRTLRTGLNHSCGLTAGGTIACWGANGSGQLGDGGTAIRSSPTAVRTDVRFVSVSPGYTHTCALATDGGAWCWGANAAGQLGTGTREEARTPVAVAGGLRFTALSAGGTHTCGVTESGELYCWGRNTYGQLGTGSTADQAVPTRVETGARVAAVSAGGAHTCARARSGATWCWGRNLYGQLGDGTTTDRATPVRVTGGVDFRAVSATGAHSCGLTDTGDTWCWGFNVEGQLGDGTRNHAARPVRVSTAAR